MGAAAGEVGAECFLLLLPKNEGIGESQGSDAKSSCSASVRAGLSRFGPTTPQARRCVSIMSRFAYTYMDSQYSPLYYKGNSSSRSSSISRGEPGGKSLGQRLWLTRHEPGGVGRSSRQSFEKFLYGRETSGMPYTVKVVKCDDGGARRVSRAHNDTLMGVTIRKRLLHTPAWCRATRAAASSSSFGYIWS